MRCSRSSSSASISRGCGSTSCGSSSTAASTATSRAIASRKGRRSARVPPPRARSHRDAAADLERIDQLRIGERAGEALLRHFPEGSALPHAARQGRRPHPAEARLQHRRRRGSLGTHHQGLRDLQGPLRQRHARGAAGVRPARHQDHRDRGLRRAVADRSHLLRDDVLPGAGQRRGQAVCASARGDEADRKGGRGPLRPAHQAISLRGAAEGPRARPDGASSPLAQEEARLTSQEVTVQGKRLKLSNLDKVLYPKAGFTKAQVIDYYLRIAPLLLPHLRDRPLTMKRYPDGVEGEFFYEKNCPSHRPKWVKTAKVWSEGNQKTMDYCLANDLPTLVWAANLADLELHTSLSRTNNIERPTMMAFDLDPGAPTVLAQCCNRCPRMRDW